MDGPEDLLGRDSKGREANVQLAIAAVDGKVFVGLRRRAVVVGEQEVPVRAGHRTVPARKDSLQVQPDL